MYFIICLFRIEFVSEFDLVEFLGDFGSKIDFGFCILGDLVCMCWDLVKFGDFLCLGCVIIVVIFVGNFVDFLVKEKFG